MERRLRILEAVDQPRDSVWDQFQEYAEVTAVRDGECAYQLLCEQKFDLVFLNLMLSGLDGLELLRRIRQQELCSFVVLTSEFPDFQYAQQGILYGAFDYLLRPLTEETLLPVILRVRDRMGQGDSVLQRESIALAEEMGSPQLVQRFDEVVQALADAQGNNARLDVMVRTLYRAAVERTFADRPWLARFEQQEAYDTIDWMGSSSRSIVRDYCRRRLEELSGRIAALYSKTGCAKLDNILLYLLDNVDGGCLQKDVAAAHYLSNTALSELFRSQLGRTYRSYVTDIKMLRAQYLLKYTDQKVYEISAQLGYRDVNYFSRMFRQRYGVPLSQYRQQMQDYQI